MEKEWRKAERKLLSLPETLGFNSIHELIDALRDVAGRREKTSIGNKNKQRRTRKILTPEIKASVKELVTIGKTAAHIAERVQISIPSVNNIKKELNLVRRRS